MVNLIFKGHATRGKELHKLLEHLGGVDSGYKTCSCVTSFYYINRKGYIEGSNMIPDYMNHRIIMSLETFESKYPYKVGDKVQHKDATSCGSIYEVEKMRWEEDTVKYTVHLFGCNYKSSTLPSEYLQPYKKETMEKEISGAIIDRFICLEGYDFYDDKGNIIDTKEITMKKKKPEYPKTYKECCNVLGHVTIDEVRGYKDLLLDNLQMLIICRDAYWKLAGDWKPYWSIYDHKFCIGTDKDKVIEECVTTGNRILAFPTKEMRDAFYENFKELIESCKELL